MSTENTTYLELLERRIELLESLSSTLLAARSAMASFDIDGLESRVTQQQTLCMDIQKIDEEMERLQYQCAAHLRLRGGEEALANSEALEKTLLRLHQAQASVKELNTSHQALLNRSRLTVTALLNSLHTFEGNYEKTALKQTASADPREKV